MKSARRLLLAGLALAATIAAPAQEPYSDAEQAILALIPPRNPVNPTEMSVAAAEAGARVRPRDADAWHQLGESLDVAGRYPESVRAFDRATRLPPRIYGRAYLYRDLAEAHEKVGDLAAALAAARVMIRSWPLSRDGLHCTGYEVRLMVRLLVKTHDIAGALALYRPLARAAPDRADCRAIEAALNAALRGVR